MSEYSDIEQLWERRNYEEKQKGINSPKITPDDIGVATSKTDELSILLSQRKITNQLIARIISQKFTEAEIPDEIKSKIAALSITENIPFDELESFIETHIWDFIKQSEMTNENEEFEPLKLEDANVDTKGLNEKRAELNRNTSKTPPTHQPIPNKTTENPRNVGEERE